MTGEFLQQRFNTLCTEEIPLPGLGKTTERLLRLLDIGRDDLSLAKLVEAHWDAVSILAEAGRSPVQGCTYAVWAAESSDGFLRIDSGPNGLTLSGTKPFCTGSTLVDRALLTVREPEHALIDFDLKANADKVRFDFTFWNSPAFAATATARASFQAAPIARADVFGNSGWYVARPGFWHGALGPAACWAGGAIGLLDQAKLETRKDAHSLAHLGAMEAAGWAMRAYLAQAGDEVDRDPSDVVRASMRALTVRHLVEQASSETLRRFARAFGPAPLACKADVSRRYSELDLYLRQSHAERDLESLGNHVRRMAAATKV